MSITKTCVLAIVAATAICFQSTAIAAVSTSNIGSLPSPDGQNITSDSLTELDWLDPAVTLNQSFDTVTVRFGTDLAGFSYATRQQLITFFAHLPIPLSTAADYDQFIGSDADAWYSSSSYFGTTHVDVDPDNEFQFVYGLTADPYPGFSEHYYYLAGINGQPVVVTGGNYSMEDDQSHQTIGSWLIRSSPASNGVPEPASIVLWGVLACCGVASARLRRRTTDSRGR